MSQPTDRPAEDVWTVGRIIDWTTGHLRKHGSETPRLDAEILLAHVRNCPRIQLYVHYSEPLTEPQRSQMRDLVKRRAQAEPVAYLVGHREFFSLNFHITRDVLIPRPETETLVLELVTGAKGRSAPRILEVGTGSGCIAIAAAVNLPDVLVTAVDISLRALEIARKNAERHKVADRVRFMAGDLFAPLNPGEQFEFIVSNPPYVSDSEMEALPPDIRLHEPALALRAGPQGLDVITRLVADAPARLAPGGLLLIEFSPEQAEAVAELIRQTGAFQASRLIKDSSGKPRGVAAARF